MPGEHPALQKASEDKSKAQNVDAQQQPQQEQRKSYDSASSISKDKQKAEPSSPKSPSKLRAAFSRAAKRLSSSSSHKPGRGSDALAGSEEEFEAMKKEEQRQEVYEKYNLGKKGMGKGGMQMHG